MSHVIFYCRFWSEVCAASRVDQAATHLLMMPLIWESFSSCCCFRRRSLSSRRFWYCCRILLVCCSCDKSLCSYSSSLRWDIFRRSFKEWISSSYSFTWNNNKVCQWTSRGDANAPQLLHWCVSINKRNPVHRPTQHLRLLYIYFILM